MALMRVMRIYYGLCLDILIEKLNFQGFSFKSYELLTKGKEILYYCYEKINTPLLLCYILLFSKNDKILMKLSASSSVSGMVQLM